MEAGTLDYWIADRYHVGRKIIFVPHTPKGKGMKSFAAHLPPQNSSGTLTQRSHTSACRPDAGVVLLQPPQSARDAVFRVLLIGAVRVRPIDLHGRRRG